ncbi:protein takeout-like [Schistocerca gregaria]|uniref:protein takeout-like n=1 Tax=Schistocerca gregaria TaxID=7010 RepID=UPI00211DD505|nr:protein takeout-like [Schistocerca gregaria]
MPALPAATERGGETTGAACAEARPAASSSSGWWRRSCSRRACGASAAGTATHAMAARGRGGAGPSWWPAEHLLLLLLACLGLACVCPTTGSPLPGSNPPPYLKICHRSDPVLNTCIKDSINTLIRNIKTGSPSLAVPETDPLHVDFVEVDEGSGNVSLRMSLSDINIAGLSDTNVVSVKANLLDSKFEVISKTPSFTVHGAFEGRGALLTFPLVANGLFWINMTDVTAVWILFYHTEARQDGRRYIALDEFGLDVIPSDVSYKFGEQLDGDNELGTAMNMFLNENSHEIFNQLKPRTTRIFSQLFRDVANQVLGSFPEDVLLPE